MDRRSMLRAGLALAWLELAGCDAEPARLVAVRGTVRYKRAPLREGIVVFTPDAVRGSGGPMSHAEIKPDGSYLLASNDGPGAVPGWHRVTISSSGATDARPPLPVRYGDAEQSGLSFEVKPERDNVIDIDLE
jgi:hypothetical protein